jgi:L-fuculose-phosphate aldolase
MLLQDERQQVVEYCQKLGKSGLTTGTSGNISIFNAKSGLMAISPSTLAYNEMTSEDIVIMDLDAEVVDGSLRPSSEYSMHLICYKQRQDIGAVIHTHSPKATTLAVMGWDLPAIHYIIAYSGGATIRCAPYRLFGSMELAEESIKAMEGSYACLLENHGTLTTGPDIAYAFNLAEQMEFCAEVYLQSKMVSEPKILSNEQVSAVIEKAMSSYSTQTK